MKSTYLTLACAVLGAGSLHFSAEPPASAAPVAQEPAPEKPLATGDEAPLFSLNDQNGKLVSQVAEPETWTVLAFYPKALTGG